jgi:hypothetical protein
MIRFMPFLLLPALFLLVGCPDAYYRVKDYELDGWELAHKPRNTAPNPSVVTFPEDWSERTPHPGYREIDDPVLERALLAPQKKEVSSTTTTVLWYEGLYGPWYYKWLDRHAKRVRGKVGDCPHCRLPCLEPVCPHCGRRQFGPLGREDWKTRWKGGTPPAAAGLGQPAPVQRDPRKK